MRKLPDPRRPSTGPDLVFDEGSEDGAWLSLQRAGENDDSARERSRTAQEAGVDEAQVQELELRLREWVERVETLETELAYLKRDLEVRAAYCREMERQVEEHTKAVRWAEQEMIAMRARASYRVADAIVSQVSRRPALERLGRTWARKLIGSRGH
jgi:chromosome segregation ATPase